MTSAKRKLVLTDTEQKDIKSSFHYAKYKVCNKKNKKNQDPSFGQQNEKKQVQAGH